MVAPKGNLMQKVKEPGAKARERIRRGCKVLFVLVALAFVLPSTLGGRAGMAVVHGGSMEPAYDAGALAVTWQGSTYDVGDVIVYDTGVGGVVHRVVSVSPDGRFATQGDNRSQVDPWTPTLEQVQGRVVFAVPVFGSIVSAAQRTLGPLGLAIVAGLAIALGSRSGRSRRWSDPRGTLSSPGREILLGSAATFVGFLATGLVVLRTAEGAWGFFIAREVLWRAVAFLGMGSLFVMALGFLAARGVLDRLETITTDLRLGSRLVDVDGIEADGRVVAPVTDLAGLLKAADTTASPVLRHDLGDGTVRYAVATATSLIVLDIALRPGVGAPAVRSAANTRSAATAVSADALTV